MLLRAPITGQANGWEELAAAGLTASLANMIGSPDCFEHKQLERSRAQKTFRKST
jgi:hypothetical protein